MTVDTALYSSGGGVWGTFDISLMKVYIISRYKTIFLLMSSRKVWLGFGNGSSITTNSDVQWNSFWETTLTRGHPPWKGTWQCKSKHKCIYFYPGQEATPLERPLFWCKRGGLTRGVPLFCFFYCIIKPLLTQRLLTFLNIIIQSLYD